MSNKLFIPQHHSGQKYFHDNMFSMITGKLVGLVCFLAIPSVLRTLINSNATTSPRKAFRRWISTTLHVLTWYADDLRPDTAAWKSLETIRRRHVSVQMHSERSQAGIISQRDMALTQFAFCGYVMLRPHMIGLRVSTDDYDGFVHFWRVIGHMQGIREEFNVCAGSWETTRPRMELLVDEVFKPLLENTSADFYHMSVMMLNGIWCLNPLLNYGAFLYFVRMMVGCDGYVYWSTDSAMLRVGGNVEAAGKRVRAVRRSIGWVSRVNLWIHMQLQCNLMTFDVVKAYMNWHLRTAVWLLYNIPLLAIWQFGPKWAFVRIMGDK